MSEIRYLTIDQVRRLHRRALEAFGWLDGVRSEQLLASAVFSAAGLDQAGFFAWVALRAQQTRTTEEARVIDFPTER